jgi:uncharacterized protein YndB with AHSA1/START domain
MPEQAIFQDVYILASPGALWNALTDPEVTQRYWGDTRIESDWRVGSKILYRRGGAVTDEQTILEIAPPTVLVHTFKPLFGEFAHETPSRVAIRISASGPVCRLELTHDGFPPGSRVLPACRVGWPRILSSLKTLLETGAPLPEPDLGG